MGTYSIDDFNAKIKVVILQQRQDWEPPQIKELRLVIPKDHTFMADDTIFIALGKQDKYLEMTRLIRSTLCPGSYKTSLVVTALQTNQESQKQVGWKTIKFVGPHVCL